MDKLPFKLKTAILCAGVADQLYEETPWFIDMTRGNVHVTKEFFHNTFDTWYTESPENIDSDYHIHNVNGVRVFCLVQREAPHD